MFEGIDIFINIIQNWSTTFIYGISLRTFVFRHIDDTSCFEAVRHLFKSNLFQVVIIQRASIKERGHLTVLGRLTVGAPVFGGARCFAGYIVPRVKAYDCRSVMAGATACPQVRKV